MSKYNHKMSIPVESIPDEEMETAIKEWAEENEPLEILLKECYKRGLKTYGCHGKVNPYIDFIYQDNMERLNCFFDVIEFIPNSSIYIMIDGSNPISGPDWDKSVIDFGLYTKYKEESDIFFNSLIKSLKEERRPMGNSFLDLLQFFQNKESGLSFRFINIDNKKYDFVIESLKLDDRYSYFNELFTEAGLKEIKTDHPRYYWGITSNNLSNIKEEIDDASRYIISNYDFEPPNKEEDIPCFHLLARYKKKHLSEDEFNDWLKSKLGRINKF